MFRKLRGDLGDDFDLNTLDSKEIKEDLGMQNAREEINSENDIYQIEALPDGKLLIYLHGWNPQKNYLKIYDIVKKLFIKTIEIESLKSFQLLSDTELIVFRHCGSNALLFDLNLNFLMTFKSSYSLTHFVTINENILIGYQKCERNNELYDRNNVFRNPNKILSQFLKAAGYDKINFLTSLGNDKAIAVMGRHFMSIIEWRAEAFIQIGKWDLSSDEFVNSVAKINDNFFIVCTSVLNTIFTKEKKEEVQHLRIYNTDTLDCVEDIILPDLETIIRQIKVLADGKTLIGWDTLGSSSRLYEINIETFQQRIIELPRNLRQLTVTCMVRPVSKITFVAHESLALFLSFK